MKRSASIFGTSRLSILTIHTLLLTLLVAAPLPLTARKWLIKSHDQLKTNAINAPQSWENGDPVCYQNTKFINRAPDGTKRFCDIALLGLHDGDPEKDIYVTDNNVDGHDTAPWMSVDNPDEPNYIDVDISQNPINLTDGNTIVVYTKRHTVNALSHPTGFRIEASTDGTNYETVAYAYFLYRGINTTKENWESTLKGTKEYSARIKIDESWTKYKQLRFYVTANNTKNRVRGDGGTLTENRKMTMAAFNVMQLNEDEHYSDILVDRFHLVTDYSYKYYYYDFVPTLGIFDKRNRYNKIKLNQWTDQDYNLHLKDFTIFPGEESSPWLDLGDSIVWNKDKQFLAEHGIEMPVFKKLRHEQDSRISKDQYVPGTETENWRQSYHEIEHVLYTIPGDPIALYPFFEIKNTQIDISKYAIRFAHWYNYRTGGNSEYLDFLSDPSLICKSENYGYYGGRNISEFTKKDPTDPEPETPENPGEDPKPDVPDSPFEIKDIESYKKFIEYVNGDYPNLDAKITADLDFNGETVSPIGATNIYTGKKYKGNFDGGGHTIKNLVIETTNQNECVGMFGCIESPASIKDIYLDQTCSFKGYMNIGMIGYVDGGNEGVSINNIVSYANVQTTNTNQWAWHYVGGLTGKSKGNVKIENCSFSGSLTAPQCFGAIGVYESENGKNITLNNCYSTATFNGINDSQDNNNGFGFFISITNVNGDAFSINNCFSNKINESLAHEKNNIKIIKQDYTGYYVEKDGKNIYVNSADFATVLGAEWKYDETLGLVPFVNAEPTLPEKPEEPTEPINPDEPKPEQKDLDIVKDLNILREKIYGTKTEIVDGKKTITYKEGSQDPGNVQDIHKHWIGAVGTFLVPRPTGADTKGVIDNLPADPSSPDSNDKDYLIAADFSTIFINHDKLNVSTTEGKIYEPTVTFRHIFRIKDGKAFADEFSGSKKANEDYVYKNRQIVSAREGVNNFRIRLDCPIPVQIKGDDKNLKELPPPTTYYYKISDTDYRRIRGMEPHIYQIDDNGNKTTTNLMEVQLDDQNMLFDGEGTRAFEETFYNICGGGCKYSKMIVCKGKSSALNNWQEKLVAGNYILELVALDVNGNEIIVYGGNENDKLIVQRYDIEILPESRATIRKSGTNQGEALHKDENNNLEYDLGNKYGDPVSEITFNEYSYLLKDKQGDNLTNAVDYKTDYLQIQDTDYDQVNAYFKWPLRWDKSTYGFPFSTKNNNGQEPGDNSTLLYNYNVYLIANNFNATPFHDSSTGENSKYDVSFYKEKALGNTNPTKGFFFWMNSASDPCVAAKLPLGSVCSGSTVHISLWMQEASNGNESGNLAINFNAVSKNGKKTLLNSFKTGTVPTNGNWYNVQYNFAPPQDRIEELDNAIDPTNHYEIELVNNCRSSEQADYAIDEIRVYVVAPEVKAEQMEPICENPDKTKVKISLPFEKFLTSIGVDEATGTDVGQDVNVYYSFIDKDVFNKELKASNYNQAFDKAVLRYNYDGGEKKDQYYGKLMFKSNFSMNTTYPGDETIITPAAEGEVNDYIGKLFAETITKEGKPDEHNLVIIAEPINENHFVPGKEYYIAILLDEKGVYSESNPPTSEDFQIQDQCASKGVFTVKSSNTILVTADESEGAAPDGEYCLGSSPTIKVELNGITDEQLQNLTKTGYDWYAGSLDEFNAEGMDETIDHTLEAILTKFRETNPECTDINNAIVKAGFTEDMKTYLKEMTEKRVKDGRHKLVLGGLQYNFTPGKLIATDKDMTNYVTAVPYMEDDLENVRFCRGAVEIPLKVTTHAPGMKHGLQIPYPDEIIDVPLRMGLKQIKAAMANDHTLRIPLLKVEAPSSNATRLKLKQIQESVDENVYLLETNDPAYRTVMLEAAKEEKLLDEELFPVVGHIAGMTATKTDTPKEDNAFYVKFDNVPAWSKPGASAADAGSSEKPFEFHEGYYYTMKFNIVETNDAGDLNSNVCPGQHIFTIKVVPEYLKWNGAQPTAGSGTDNDGKSLNWNNDNNWSRVEADDLYWDDTKATNNVDYIVGSKNDNDDDVYAPLDFTKVIIGNGAEYPRMYHVTDEAVEGTDLDSHLWSNLNKTETTTNNAPANGAGDATHHIYYDMAAYTKDIPTNFNKPDGVSGVAVSCRPWYANTAEQVHFLTNSEVYAQQHLRYDKAWVDMEMKPDNWYTSASPLQSIYAGDMYLPTKGARQVTPLFEGITFDNELKINDRFRPAVYQRSWNLASDKIYEQDGSVRDGVVKLDWSNVYNDVTVNYASGEGFSIKTDVSEATNITEGNNVLFRFPKEDTNYQYFVYYDETDRYKNVSHDVPKSEETHGKLNPTNGSITIKANGTSPYFLVGNPFMAHLDMKKFLYKNASKIEPTYWLLNSAKQTVTIIDGDGTAISSDGNAATTLLPPMAGFFVKAKTTGDLTLSYDETMMHVDLPKETGTGLWLDPTQQSASPSPSTRAAGMPGMIRISSVENGKTVNTALLLLGAAYDPAATAGEDAETVIDPELGVATVFTVADGNALSINALPDALGTEVGIDARAGQTTTLRFDGDGCGEGYFLTDTLTGESTPISEGMEYEVTGGAKGRLLITDGMAQAMTGIRIEQREDGEVTVTSADGSAIEVTVSDTLGRVLMRFAEGKPEVRFRPEAGVIVVHATNGVHTATKKLF